MIRSAVSCATAASEHGRDPVVGREAALGRGLQTAIDPSNLVRSRVACPDPGLDFLSNARARSDPLSGWLHRARSPMETILMLTCGRSEPRSTHRGSGAIWSIL